ncbi:class I SAM-dependent methyltransferase [Spelaeicoccus albus]|uniref:SAM-dependent methyltransferase n=1 Tax=Spelaeicoccus albus TaxID=1280376 RepID=A0A7Z0A9F3_9MICO|nr:class I SAM-dependent methyltransferase [Spelaeicoccus albus]NYI66847.1 SAM-dependent methyltransferase [Spelaeicoccus albus]
MAESFGTDAARYDRARFSYPSELIERIVERSPGPTFVDVGCGTGIAARQFAAAGCRVLGVEPDSRMAAFARHSGIDVEECTFENWDPAGRIVDAVVAGQARHWVDPAAGATKASGVLRPGGILAVFWHAFEPPRDVASAFVSAFRRAVPDAPVAVTTETMTRDAYRAICAKPAAGIRGSEAFGVVEEWRDDWAVTLTRDEWLDQLPTQGLLTQLAPDARAPILDAVGAAIDARGGSFMLKCATFTVAARRR